MARAARHIDHSLSGIRQLLRALFWLVVARAALRVWSYATVRRALDRIPPRRVAVPMSPAECEQAVRRASRLLPGASCLARAVAAVCLLRRDARDSTLSIGVRFDPGHRLHAHAWLESGGLIVTGGHGQSEHRVLLRDVIDRPGLEP